MTRRDFLTVTATAVAATALAPTAAAATRRPLKKAVMLGTVDGKLTLLEKCQLLKEAGFDGFEPDSHMDRAEVLKARDASGLAVASVCDSIHWSKHLTAADPAVRAEGLEGLKIALRDAKAYGATSVLLVPGVVDENVTYAQAW